MDIERLRRLISCSRADAYLLRELPTRRRGRLGRRFRGRRRLPHHEVQANADHGVVAGIVQHRVLELPEWLQAPADFTVPPTM